MPDMSLRTSAIQRAILIWIAAFVVAVAVSTVGAPTPLAAAESPRPPAARVAGFEGDAEGGFRDRWHTHQGFVEILGARQKPPSAIRWRSAPVPAPLPAPSVTFVWTGALGAGRGGGGNFTISVNGREAAVLDVAIEPTRFVPRAEGCELLYDSVWVYGNGLDSSGHFFLTVPASWVRSGERAVLEVKGREVGSHRWFGLLRKDDAPR